MGTMGMTTALLDAQSKQGLGHGIQSLTEDNMNPSLVLPKGIGDFKCTLLSFTSPQNLRHHFKTF